MLAAHGCLHQHTCLLPIAAFKNRTYYLPPTHRAHLDPSPRYQVTKAEFRVVFKRQFPNQLFEPAWRSIDKDGDGSLSMAELADHFGSTLAPPRPPPRPDLRPARNLRPRTLVRMLSTRRPRACVSCVPQCPTSSVRSPITNTTP